MDKLISEIADDEKVARILFSPSHIYKGRVSPKAFKLEKLKSGPDNPTASNQKYKKVNIR